MKTTNNPFRSLSRPLIMAHRGDQTVSPENTLLSLKNAALLELDVIETDIRMTRDNELILFHDETLERTTNATGRVIDYTLEELQEIDLGYWFTLDGGKTYPARGKKWSVVTLRQAFELFPDILFNLDIKNEEPEAVKLLAEIIRDYKREKRVMVGSFHHKQLKRFRKNLPEVLTSASPFEVRTFLIGLRLHLERFLNPNYAAFQVPISHNKTKIVTPRFVKAAHEKNIAVHVWVIDDRLTMEYLIRIGVDGFFTNDVWLLMEVLQDKGLM
ncbi:MAG: glycerophosphodiester phosphodiesterase [Candidatus Hodarchaeales archaeon]